MSTDEIKSKLRDAGLKDEAIEKLVAGEMLDEATLKAATNEDLKTCGLKPGEVIKVKKAFPSDPAVAASVSVTVAAPVAVEESSDSKIFGKWAGRRQMRETRYGGLMAGQVNVQSLATFGGALYYMFADLASIIPTVKKMAAEVQSGTFEISNDELRQSLRKWRREREKGLTLNLTDEERDANWAAVGKLMSPAFREILDGVAGVYEAREDVEAFDGAAVRTASGGKTSVARLRKSIVAAAKFVAENLRTLTDVLDSQADLRDEIDAALVFLRAEEVQKRCGVLDFSPETADANVAKVLQRFGNNDGAPAIQLGYDWQEFFLRMGEVLKESGVNIGTDDLFFMGESASAIQADASFVEFGVGSQEEDEPKGKPFHAEPVEPFGSSARSASTGFTKRWQVWFLKAKIDFGFSFSQSSQ